MNLYFTPISFRLSSQLLMYTRRLFSHFRNFISLVALGQDFHILTSCRQKNYIDLCFSLRIFLVKQEAEEPQVSMCVHIHLYSYLQPPVESVSSFGFFCENDRWFLNLGSNWTSYGPIQVNVLVDHHQSPHKYC